ncbi:MULTISPECIES: hypothetical protein [unclassified Natrinema]|uniref:hypothetical protein n=1 Tax=unclassified Natrinema TaxID=2622230 RepID=UPI00026D524C|nr:MULTISPECIES: hypothetical protein [unclassified Natrinema]AFO58857.1 hypothetical protein NJ7G_3641 [Natrinema sp. J7-2]
MLGLYDEAFRVGETIEHERRRPPSKSDGRNGRVLTTTTRLPLTGSESVVDTGIGRVVHPLTREQAAADGDEAGS